jgi:secreted Zn-dependent insulinase-like peptidase
LYRVCFNHYKQRLLKSHILHRVIKLKNGLTALLISKPKEEQDSDDAASVTSAPSEDGSEVMSDGEGNELH